MPSALDNVAYWDRFCDRWLPKADGDRPAPSKNTQSGDWREDPLPIQDFLKQHLNTELYPTQLADLETLLGHDPKQMFSGVGDRFQQALYLYGKGSGKDYMVSCFMIWLVHVLLCLNDPAKYLGLADGENIDIVTVAVNLQQARNVLFFKVKQRLKACTWMRDRIGSLLPAGTTVDQFFRDGNGWVGAESIRFPGNIRLWAVCSNASSFEGLNPIAFCCDEISGFTSEAELDKAKQIHQTLETSARTRFGDRWKGILITFPRHKGDYAIQLYNKYQRGQLTGFYASKKATWEVNPKVTRESLQPFYEADPESARCRFECDPPSAIAAYFSDPDKLLLHCSGAPLWILREHLPNLPEAQLEAIATLGVSPILEVDNSGDPILDRRGFPKLARWFRGQTRPSGEPYDYYAHLDPGASGDAFGCAIAHIHELPDGSLLPTLDLAFRWTGRMFKDFGEITRESWFADTVRSHEQVVAGEVDFRTVREFLFFLKVARGINFAMVTFDGWNSVESTQELRKRDIPVGVHLVNKDDYDHYKQMIYTRTLRYYGYPVLIQESLKLQLLNGTKVDAPRTREGEGDRADSHKDVSDAVAAVCRRMAAAKDETVEFLALPHVESIWEKAEKTGQPIKMEADPKKANQVQDEILQRFFND